MNPDLNARLAGIENTQAEQQDVLSTLIEAALADEAPADETPSDETRPAARKRAKMDPRTSLGGSRRWRHRKPWVAGAASKPAGPKRVPWWNLDASDPAAAAQILTDVHAFGETIRARYILDYIPDTWTGDDALVRDFTGLLVQWEGAYEDAAAEHTWPQNWRDALERFIGETRSYMDRRNNKTANDGI